MTLFTDLKLDPKVLKAVQEAGYDTPTPIQKGAIPPALEGKDVLGIAQTGTGKTAGFTLPMITRLARGRARARMPRSLILCPTRELAAQVAENFDLYAKYTRLTKALLIGGVSFSEQDKLIDRGVDVLIATPGRLLDHFERGKLLLTGVEVMVVDEADRMLDMGFIPDIERIFQLTPFTRQTLFFSATMAPEIERITDTFLHSPVRVEVARQATASETIEQRLVTLTPTRKDQTAKQKRQLLRALIDSEGDRLTNAIIFSNRKTDVDILTKSLRTHGYDAAAIHGDLNQSHRTRTLDDFREGRLRFLVASDVAARGLDIPEVSHVFNYDLPRHAEDYVHRIGRTGRAGRDGVSISIEEPLDDKNLAAIESLLKRSLPRSPAPEGFIPSEGRKQADSKPAGRSRSRSGRGRGQDRDRHDKDSGPGKPEDVPAAKAEASAGKEPARRPSRDSARNDGARNDSPRHQEPAESRSRDTGDSPRRREEPRAGGQRSNDRGRGSTIRGMGDHVPEFLTRSFLDALAATERADAARPDEPPATPADSDRAKEDEAKSDGRKHIAATEKAVPTARPEVEAESPADTAEVDKDDSDTAKSSRSRTTRSRTTSKPAETPEAEADETASPKPTRRRSPSRSRAAQAADDTAEADRTDADKSSSDESGDTASTETADTTETATEDAPKKPVTRRRTSTRTRSTTAAPKTDIAPDKEASSSDAAAHAKPAASRSPAKSTAAKTTAKDAPAEKPAARKAPARKPAAKPAPKADGEASEQPPAAADDDKKPAAKKPASRTSTARKTTAKAKAEGEDDADATPKPARRTSTPSTKAATEAAEGGADNDKP